MKLLRLAIVLTILAWFVSGIPAEAEVIKPDLKEAVILGRGPCFFPPHVGYCFVLEKWSTNWVVVHDEKGQLAIYVVKPSVVIDAQKGTHITPEDTTLVWQRDET